MKKLWKDTLNFKQNLQRRLPKMAAKYFAAGRGAMSPGTSWNDMHQFRLQTKRFRYTLETFRPAYGPGLERRIEALKRVQTFLGDINDCIVTGNLLADIEGAGELRARLAERADAKTKKLRSFWMREFDAPGQEAAWLRYLRGYVCRRPPAPRRRLTSPVDAAEEAPQ